MPILVYVAGPYTGDTEPNIRAAQRVAAQLISPSVFPVVPHEMNQHLAHCGDIGYWYRATLEIMLRCDAVVLVERWCESTGAIAEVAAAHRAGISVYETVAEFEARNERP